MFAIGTLLAVFGFLLCRAAAVGASNVLLLLRLGLHLAIIGIMALAATSERDAVLKDLLKIVHSFFLMVEQAHTSKGHSNAVFVAGHNDMVVTHGAASLGDILHTALVGTLNVVAEGEEGVAA